MSYLHGMVFGIYPYVCLAVFLFGSLVRFDREQYTWRSESSQMLKTGTLRLGSNLFHLGILGLFFGHAVGMLTPPVVFHTLGIEASSKQMLAIVAGGVFGASCLIGLLLLLARRLGDARLRATTRRMDMVVLFWILATLLLGLVSIVFSLGHADGSVMLLLMAWARAIVTLDFSAAAIIVTVPWIYKLHMFMGMTLFLLFPFSRLVHVWSGFGALGYLGRSYQLVRSRR